LVLKEQLRAKEFSRET